MPGLCRRGEMFGKKEEITRHKINMRAEQIIPASFLLVILIGTLLLMLPVATAEGEHTSLLTALFTSTTSVCRSFLASVNFGLMISQASACFLSNAAFFITPGRTVAIAGRKRGQMIEAIKWPPNAGRVILRSFETSWSFPSTFAELVALIRSSGRVEAERRKSW